MFVWVRFCFLQVALLTSLVAGPPAPFGAVPHPRQLAWQRMELYAFVHFGLNTWTDREWGYGDEDPALFNPDAFDARAIVRTFREAGMAGMILTAKHHDGFCLWPSATTEHDIAASPWRGGRGDLVREFSDACRAEGLKFGIYVSPWDRNHAEYGREGYVKVFHQQIREVLESYGPVFEIWFDGANGGDGFYGGAREKRSIPPGYYRFPEAVETIRKLQPQCVVWGAGDARWGGSEQGHVGDPHWHTMDSKIPGNGATGVRLGDTWMPAEGDTSIRPGWFWHEREDSRVKPATKLMDVWFQSVGRGANLILNVPPDRSGRLRAPDIASLTEFRRLRDQLLSRDFAAAATSEGTSGDPMHPPAMLVDGDLETFWTPAEAEASPTVTLGLVAPATFDVVRLREQIRLGQRVDGFAIEVETAEGWKTVHEGRSIGHQVLVRLSRPVTASRLRLRITSSAATPCISEIALFKLPAMRNSGTGIPASQANLDKSAWKVIAATSGDATRAIDGDPDTLWHTHMEQEQAPTQHFIVDIGVETRIAGFTYLPRQDGVAHGLTDRYRFELSRDGRHWLAAAEGEFSNIRANPVEQAVSLKSPVAARFFRFTGLRALERNHVSAAEIGLIAAP